MYTGGVERLNVTLDEEHTVKLTTLARRMHVQPGTLARSLLSSALDDSDPDPHNVVDLLDGIIGAREHAELGLEQARAGDTMPLRDL